MELVAPAGSLTAGIYALNAGADAVYFGLPQFSARKGATNLTLSEVRRLKTVALANDARIFAAINTIIAENEREKLASTIPELILSGVDGIIIQDLGLAHFMRTAFPELPLHGSTQLAVHNPMGLLAAEKLGFKRVVLARELSLDEINELKSIAQSVEKEVFVHGALCYGFSGLCLASAMLTGRSGNRGECAQICRSWFDTKRGKGYYFSLSDLDAGSLISGLRRAEVTALKIEGRLKSLAYVESTTRYYRALLDGDEEKAAHYREKSALGFSRPKSHGYLSSTPHGLTNPDYPSHVGIPGAKVVSVKKGKTTITALTPLYIRDRLFRRPTSPPDEGETIPIDALWVNGKKRRSLKPGQQATIRGIRKAKVGTILSKTLAHDMHLKQIAPSTISPHKSLLPLFVAVTDRTIELGTLVLGKQFSRRYPVTIEPSIGNRSFNQVLKERFSLKKGFGFMFDSPSPLGGMPPADHIFIPPSMLKGIRNSFFEAVQNSLALLYQNRYTPEARFAPTTKSPSTMRLPQRESIVYDKNSPFWIDRLDDPIELPLINNTRYLSLPPVWFHSEKSLMRIEAELGRNFETPIAIGLNNIGHLTLIQKWRHLSHVSFYIDYGLYVGNIWTLRYFSVIPRLRGAYLWLEASLEQQQSLKTAIENEHLPIYTRMIDSPRQFPLFISRTCPFGHTGKPQCPRKCNGNYEMSLHQNDRHFHAQVIDCITYLYLTN